jgi:hypothetical protein
MGPRPKQPRKPNADYASRAGDARRQGRVDRDDALRAADAAGRPRIEYVSKGGHHAARLGVLTIGAIHPAPEGLRYDYTWLCFLPGSRPMPSPATDFGKACAALTFTIEQWFEAVGHPLPRSR